MAAPVADSLSLAASSPVVVTPALSLAVKTAATPPSTETASAATPVLEAAVSTTAKSTTTKKADVVKVEIGTACVIERGSAPVGCN